MADLPRVFLTSPLTVKATPMIKQLLIFGKLYEPIPKPMAWKMLSAD